MSHSNEIEMLDEGVTPLQVCRSAAGYYIGRLDELGVPFSRESLEYFPNHQAAQDALDCGNWKRRSHL